jgi:hypothetical protein
MEKGKYIWINPKETNLLTLIFYLCIVISPRSRHCCMYILSPTPKYCRKSVTIELCLLTAMPQLNLCLALICRAHWCPLASSFSLRKRWNADGAKSGLYGRVIQDAELIASNLYSCSMTWVQSSIFMLKEMLDVRTRSLKSCFPPSLCSTIPVRFNVCAIRHESQTHRCL